MLTLELEPKIVCQNMLTMGFEPKTFLPKYAHNWIWIQNIFNKKCSHCDLNSEHFAKNCSHLEFNLYHFVKNYSHLEFEPPLFCQKMLTMEFDPTLFFYQNLLTFKIFIFFDKIWTFGKVWLLFVRIVYLCNCAFVSKKKVPN